MSTQLRRAFGIPERPPRLDTFALVVWENVAYLVPDDHRREVFKRLERTIGMTPAALADVSMQRLIDTIREQGGMRPEHRARKVRAAATIARDVGVRVLNGIASLELKRARTLLKRFPGIGEPGADKLLMFAGAAATLAPESNGLRVLSRLGYGGTAKSYAAAYRAVVEETSVGLPRDREWLIDTHLMLRRHGQTVCRASAPECAVCPVRSRCRWFNRQQRTR